MNTSKMKNLYESRYGISEAKQAQLKLLGDEVQDSEYKTEELQAVVDSLTEKSNTAQSYLANALAGKETALGNLNLLNTTVSAVSDSNSNSKLILNKSQEANDMNQCVAEEIATITEKVIFSADMINRLSVAINTKKALIPLIPGDLVNRMSITTVDANKAVATMLTALQSCYVATATINESHETICLEHKQSTRLHFYLTGKPDPDSGIDEVSIVWNNLKCADEAFSKYLTEYVDTNEKFDIRNKELCEQRENLINCEKKIHKIAAKRIRSEGEMLEKTKEKIEHDLTRLNKVLENAEAELKKADNESDKLKADILRDDARLKCEAAERDLEDVINRLIEITEHNDKLDAKIKEYNRVLAKHNKELNKINEEMKILKAKLKEVNLHFNNAKKTFDTCYRKLDKTLTQIARTDEEQSKSSLEYMLTNAYKVAVKKYNKELDASKRVTKELEHANKRMVIATNNLSSLKAGLEAATAAALAA